MFSQGRVPRGYEVVKSYLHLFREHLESITLYAPTDQSCILTFTTNFSEGHNRALIFKAPGCVTRDSSIENMLKTAKVIYSQWSNFNDSIYVGEQDYSLKLTTISGLGSGLKTTASNHKIQTNISIKGNHSYKKVLNFFAKHLHPCEQDNSSQ